jgi:predicted RNA-binding Zn ribbon-like protein
MNLHWFNGGYAFSMSAPTHPQAAPGRLELVREFVNTLNVEAGTDQLADVAGWQRWAQAMNVVGPASEVEIQRAVHLREALRAGLLANHDREPLPEVTAAALTEVAGWPGVRVAFTSGGLRLYSDRGGITGLVVDVTNATADALADGTWSRLKACVTDTCRWAFYDHSRSRTGRWCSMGICGNRAKQSRWRDRQEQTRRP